MRMIGVCAYIAEWCFVFLQNSKVSSHDSPLFDYEGTVIDKRIESSWEIQDKNHAKPSKKIDSETLQENFKKLKEKHQI